MLCPDGIGLLLRTVREAAGRTREQQAAYLSELGGQYVDPENLKRWETEKRLPVPYWHALLSQGFGIPVSQIQKAIVESRRYRRASGAAAILLDQEDDDMHRRTAVFGTAAIAAGIATDPWGRLAAAVSRPKVTAEEAHELVKKTDALFTTEEHLPARLLARRLASHLETLTALIPGAGPHEKALTVAAAETAALAGWAAFDQGHHDDALHYYRTTALAGKEAGHPPAIALAMGYASYSAAPDKAREMLKSAQDHVKGRGYAAARSWLAAREAEEAAGVGDRDGAVRALDRATTAFDYAEPGELAWMSFYRQARLDSFVLSTYAKVRHPELTEAADSALEHLGDDDTKVRIAVLHDVSTGYLVAGEIAQGAEVGRRFLEAATATPTTMGRQRMGQLAAVLPSDTAAARALAEDIRAALAA
ncbi:transcriptional regulator [Streptomyces sp. Isolate_219]|uniref:transcriptional regulator n=1 Tax=Streptomyces sp. Isolate_219 TaxID=2950110 RepID=UPI0021C8A585|nr:transcriptional regulator [Streptomyces sp. Isolate_219]MCR8573591.1 transcriptional regulator [Streptomyces sp. Isolate_219]